MLPATDQIQQDNGVQEGEEYRHLDAQFMFDPLQTW